MYLCMFPHSVQVTSICDSVLMFVVWFLLNSRNKLFFVLFPALLKAGFNVLNRKAKVGSSCITPSGLCQIISGCTSRVQQSKRKDSDLQPVIPDRPSTSTRPQSSDKYGSVAAPRLKSEAPL